MTVVGVVWAYEGEELVSRAPKRRGVTLCMCVVQLNEKRRKTVAERRGRRMASHYGQFRLDSRGLLAQRFEQKMLAVVWWRADERRSRQSYTRAFLQSPCSTIVLRSERSLVEKSAGGER